MSTTSKYIGYAKAKAKRYTLFSYQQYFSLLWVVTPCSNVVKWRWRQQGPPKRWYSATSLHGTSTQKDHDLNLYRHENPKSKQNIGV